MKHRKLCIIQKTELFFVVNYNLFSRNELDDFLYTLDPEENNVILYSDRYTDILRKFSNMFNFFFFAKNSGLFNEDEKMNTLQYFIEFSNSLYNIVLSKYDAISSDVCPICLETCNIYNVSFFNNCRHFSHKSCSQSLSCCPLCRALL